MRENGFRAIGGLAQRLTSGIAKGRGASIARLRAEWTAIVGPDLARITRPEALLSGRGARAGKALRLRVAGAAALATVVGVLVEVPVMLSVVRIVLRTRGWYEHARTV